MSPVRLRRPLQGYLAALLAVAAATVATFLIYPWIEPSISLLFFPAILLLAMYTGYGPALFATVLSTLSLAFFFVPPRSSFDIGIDDVIRLAVFVVVAVGTASFSYARKRAEDALRKSLSNLQQATDTLRQVSGWPVLIGPDMSAGARTILQHAAKIVGSAHAVAVWEAEDEPWVYLADSASNVSEIDKHPPASLTPFVPEAFAAATLLTPDRADAEAAVIVSHDGSVSQWRGQWVHAAIASRLAEPGCASAAFRTEHLTGRVFFSGLADVGVDKAPIIDVVAREIGTSFDQVFLGGRMQEVAIGEERIRLARDLHDGVLQTLTGIRFELQAIAEEAGSSQRDRLLAIERGIAIEQRELRLFIDDIKPTARATSGTSPLAQDLEAMRVRLGAEWKTPIAIRLTPAALSLPEATARAVRLMIHEAIVNAMQHGQPSRVSVDLYGGADLLQIVITDDGRGFPFRGRLEHDELVGSASGPASLRDRVVALGGRIAIESKVAGSRVEIAIPA
jgi:signal transduction histidine kinase